MKVLLFFILIIGIILMSGCIGEEESTTEKSETIQELQKPTGNDYKSITIEGKAAKELGNYYKVEITVLNTDDSPLEFDKILGYFDPGGDTGLADQFTPPDGKTSFILNPGEAISFKFSTEGETRNLHKMAEANGVNHLDFFVGLYQNDKLINNRAVKAELPKWNELPDINSGYYQLRFSLLEMKS